MPNSTIWLHDVTNISVESVQTTAPHGTPYRRLSIEQLGGSRMQLILFASKDNTIGEELQMKEDTYNSCNKEDIVQQLARLRAEELAAPGTWNKVIEMFECLFPGL